MILLEHMLKATVLPCGYFRKHLRYGFTAMVSVFSVIQILGPPIHLVVVADEGSFCEKNLLEDLLVVIFLIFMLGVRFTIY